MRKLMTIAFCCILSAVAYAQQAVDMGLSVKWASCNLGASSPEQSGQYYAWGETSTKTEYSWRTYKLRDLSAGRLVSHVTKYCSLPEYGTVDKLKILQPEDDAATKNLGSKWRMPTDKEWEELMTQCKWAWTKKNGRDGYLVTSRKTGNSIFLPAAGHQYLDSLTGEGALGFYWSSSRTNSYGASAWMMCFGSQSVKDETIERFAGQSIRPVCK